MNQFGDEDLNSILLGIIPKHEELCYLMGTINLSEKNTANISNKAYQCQIFKCRCLIFSVPEVIASPVLGAVQHIHIIISWEFYLSEKLMPHLEKMNIKVEEPIPLTNGVYEACLRYTILARLAPSWNQVERYLVHGRDFLLSSFPLDAVKLDIVINETDMHVVLWPLRLRLPQVCAQDFQSSSLQPPLSWDLASNNFTVHVLPSLNQANVLMVSGHIPQNSLFKSYKELKRHWKNSYGYRLPDSEEGMIYLTVKFGRWFSESLTYPVMCVRARRPVFLRQHEPHKVLLQLLADVHAKIPYICGKPFGLETTVRYAVPRLNTLSEALYPCNLSEIKPEMKKAEVEEKEPTTEHSQLLSQYTQTQTSKFSSQHNFKNRSSSPPPFLPRMCPPRPAPGQPVFVPVFTAKPKPHTPSSTAHSPPWCIPSSTTDKPPVQRIRPMFGGAPMKPIFGLAQTFPSHNPFHTNKPLASNFREESGTSFPIFSPSSSSVFHPRKGEKTLLRLTESGIKKSRNKPQIQQGVDVKALAHSQDGLAKVNTTTLIAYLRAEGVPCKVKDKKGELVTKVLAHLGLPTPSHHDPLQEQQ